MKITAEPRSDQINADDFIGSSATFTITGIKAGTAEQKYDIQLAETGKRVWRPALTVLRLMIAAWGDEADNWIGQQVTLFRDPDVQFGKDTVGGIRISHMTNLPGNKPLEMMLQERRGKRKLHRVEPLAATPAPSPADAAISAFASINVTVEQLTAKLGGRTQGAWTDADIAGLRELFTAIKNGDTTVGGEFE